MPLDFSRCRLVPLPDGTLSGIKAHAKVGVEALVTHPVFALFDEMGAMKSAQTIIAAQFLFEQGTVDNVIVVAPAAVRAVWFDAELGELAKHLWDGLCSEVTEFHAKTRSWTWSAQSLSLRRLRWTITNYDFIRSSARLEQLLKVCGPKTLLVLDESSAVKNFKAKQTRACLQIRRKCGRVILLNGTPIANNPLDMFSQGRIMDPEILGCANYYVARARYAVITTRGGFPKITGWQHLEDLQQRFAPYVLRRLKKDCLDLPPALPSVMLTATLTPETWKTYKEMRDELCIWLDQASVSTAAQAPVKVMRLAQITSGFVGGVEHAVYEPSEPEPEWMPPFEGPSIPVPLPDIAPVRYLGREKLDVVIAWLKDTLELYPDLKLLVWTRFRPELARLVGEVTRFAGVSVGQIHGGQKREDRETALRLLDPRTAPAGPVVVGGTTQTGSMGLSLVASHHVIHLSSDFSLKTRLQADARTDRPGQVHVCHYFDVVAVGPQGQKTVDHLIQKTRLGKEDVANYTTSAWIRALKDE
jgi:hypothetical protein